MAFAKTIEELELQGGAPCLDLINTGIETEPGLLIERLTGYNDVLTLIGRLKLLDRPMLQKLQDGANRNPKQAREVLEGIRTARKDIHDVFLAIWEGKLPAVENAVIERLNKGIRKALASQHFIRKGNRMVRVWDISSAGMWLASAVFYDSANTILSTADLSLIRKCEGCEWLFIDTSKSHRRKWCNMQSCGSLVKSRKYYRRKTGLE